MNPLWTQIITQTTLKTQKKGSDGKYSDFQLAKGLRELKIIILNYIKDALLIILGIFSAAFGFKGFLLSNHFIDGGATGISLLLSTRFDFPLFAVLLVVNIPFVLLGLRIVGLAFAVKTALAIIGLALVVALVPFPNVTDDNLLVAIFGGFFLG